MAGTPISGHHHIDSVEKHESLRRMLNKGNDFNR